MPNSKQYGQTSTDGMAAAPAFTLEYDVQPQDVPELAAATPGVKDKLTIAVVVAMVPGLVA